jgi:hypothetical protein
MLLANIGDVATALRTESIVVLEERSFHTGEGRTEENMQAAVHQGSIICEIDLEFAKSS